MLVGFVRGLVKLLSDRIERLISKLVFIGQVQEVKISENNEYRITLVRLIDGVTVPNTRIVSLGLGNLKGVLKYPQVGDLGIVVDLFGESFWLGNILDIYSKNKDLVMDLKDGMLIQSKEAGSFILFTNEDDLVLKHKDGMKIIFKNSYIRIKNSNNYGIEITSDGKVNIYGSEVNFYNHEM